MKDDMNMELGSKIKIKVKQDGQEREFEGTFIDSPDKNAFLIKLKTGYNVGFDKKDILKVEIIEKAKSIKGKEDVEQDKKLPGIALIITGGTIASKVDYKTGAVSPNQDISSLIQNIPGIEKIARINYIEVPFLELSEDICPDDWKKLAKKTCELVNMRDNKGVVILHGTDTLHYSASALSFMLKNLGKPVVLTYSQRSIDRGSSDANLNLKCSFHAALSNIAEVVIVGHANTEDSFCHVLRGSSARKMHSSRRDAFKAINQEPIAKIHENGTIDFISSHAKRDETKKCRAETEFEDKIALIKFYPGQNPDILKQYRDCGFKGIVIEGTGFGHVCVNGKLSWLSEIKETCKHAVVCMTTQCINGEVNPRVYSNGRMLEKTGVLYLNMTSEACYAKLGCVLGKEKDPNQVKMLMKENLAHEFNERRTE